MLLTPTLALFVGAASAFSYKMDDAGNELYWATTPIPVHVNTDGMDDVSEAQVLAALHSAVEDFRSADGSMLRFELIEGEVGPRAINYDDGYNAIYFTDDWDSLGLDETLLAMTYTWYMDGGEIVGFDMVVNTAHHDWSTDGDPERNDLHNTLTHELGHAVGLGHSEVEGASMYSTTFPGEIEKRGLHIDDKEALGGLYGDMEFESRLPLACATGGRGLGGTAPLLLAGFAGIGLMRRRRGSASLGEGGV